MLHTCFPIEYTDNEDMFIKGAESSHFLWPHLPTFSTKFIKWSISWLSWSYRSHTIGSFVDILGLSKIFTAKIAFMFLCCDNGVGGGSGHRSNFINGMP